MHAVHLGSLTLIAVLWFVTFRIGRRWVRWSGVDERFSVFALACVLPTAALLFSVHLLATASLFADGGHVTPENVMFVFAFLAWLAHRLVPGKGTPLSHRSDPLPDDSVRLDHPAAQGRRSGRLLWWLPALTIGGVYGVFLIDALTRYPTGCDAVVYQLVVAVRWAREQSLNLVLGHSGYSYPNNGMIVPFLLVFAKLEWLLPIVHLPKAILLGSAVFGLARAIGISQRGASVCACIALSIPIVLFQSFSGYIDLYAASAWVTALLAVVWSTRVEDPCRRRGLVAMAGLAAGVALGSKVTFVVMVTMLAAVVFAVDWVRTGNRSIATTAAWRRLALFCCAVLACSGFWFVRGMVQAGNPIYPLTLTMPGEGLLPTLAIATANGIITSADTFHDESLMERVTWLAVYPWRESKMGAGYTYGVDNGLGAAFATFVPIGLAWVAFNALTKRKRDMGSRWSLVFLVLALSSGVLLCTVFHNTLRFALPLLIVAIPAAIVAFDGVIARFPKHSAAVLTASLMATGTIATLKPAHAVLGRARDGNWQRDWFYQVPSLVDDFPPGTRILNLSDEPLNYALLGSELANDVIPPLLWAVLSEDGAVTPAALRDNRVDYIFVRESWSQGWSEALPIELIFDDSDTRALATTPATRIYRVIGTRDAVSG